MSIPAWIKIADSEADIAFNQKGIALMVAGGRRVCIIKTTDGLKACTDRCPHAGSPLSDGYVDEQQHIVCCVHNYKFSLKTGRDAMNEGYFLKRYPIKTEPDGVYILMQH